MNLLWHTKFGPYRWKELGTGTYQI